MGTERIQYGAKGKGEANPIDGGEAIDPLELYASGIDSSDYAQRVVPIMRDALPKVGDLLDIGAGGGQLGQLLRDPARSWVAVEPGAVMQRRLRVLSSPPVLHRASWQEAALADGCADTVLAATMPAPLVSAVAFLAQCRRWARRSIVWLVPSQNGPRGLCLAGCLPREWHGEDETPGIDLVMRQLPEADRPRIAGRADWTFSLITPDLGRLAAYLADRLSWPATDARRPALRQHLLDQAAVVTGGHRLSVPRASTILVWSL